MSSDELRRVLEAFNTDLFRDQVDRARTLLSSEDVSTDDPGEPVPARNIDDIYERRSGVPGAHEYIRAQCAKVAYIARRFPDENWHIFRLNRGEASFLIFANEAGVGRACIDVSKYDDPETASTR